MRVLLTGSSGFIGSRVARTLVARGDTVIGTVSPGGNPWRIEDMLGRMKVVEADLETHDLDALVVDVRPDVCIHMAWFVEPGRYLRAGPENLRSLAAGVRLLAALDRVGCPRAVLAGTCLEPGSVIDGEAREPGTIYAAAKAALHQVGSHLESAVACAHIFFLYGPGEDPRRLVPSVIRAVLSGTRIEVTSGEQRRDFLHVDDVAAAICGVALSDVRGRVDICSGASIPLRRIFEAIGEETGRPDLIAVGARRQDADEPSEIAGDATVLQRHIGWEPRWSLRDGIANSVAWWRERLDSMPDDYLRTSAQYDPARDR